MIYVIGFDPIKIYTDWAHQNDCQISQNLSFVKFINVVGEKMTGNGRKCPTYSFVIFVSDHSLNQVLKCFTIDCYRSYGFHPIICSNSKKVLKLLVSLSIVMDFFSLFYYDLLEINPCGLGSRIRDVEAFRTKQKSKSFTLCNCVIVWMVYPDPKFLILKKISKIEYQNFRVRVNHRIGHNQKTKKWHHCFF